MRTVWPSPFLSSLTMSVVLIGGESKRMSPSRSPNGKHLNPDSIEDHDELLELGTSPESAAATGAGFPFFRKRIKVDLDAIATQRSVFDDPKTLDVYRPPPQYENAHRFGPQARWSCRREEKASPFLESLRNWSSIYILSECRSKDWLPHHDMGICDVLCSLAGLQQHFTSKCWQFSQRSWVKYQWL